MSSAVYDAVGNTVATIDARGNRGTYTYDALNRQVTATDALSHTVTSVLDRMGNVVQQIDARGATTSYVYDNLDRQASVQDPGGRLYTTIYDAGNNGVRTSATTATAGS